MVFESPKQTVIFLSGKLTLQVGFESNVVLACRMDIPSKLIAKHHKVLTFVKRIQAPNPVNVNLGFDILYIYTDCVEQQIVGDVQA